MNVFEAIDRDDELAALAALDGTLDDDPRAARGTHDSGTHDSGTHDSDTHDSGTHDSGTRDSGTHNSGATPVLYAMYQHKFALARALAARIGTVNLAEASAIDDADRVSTLLALGEPVDGRTPDGFTPLQLAAYFGAPNAAAVLLSYHASVNAVADNPRRIQPLHAAAAGRHADVAALLIAAGADVNAVQRHGYTPLHSAAQNGDRDLVSALLAAGADVAATNDDGRDAKSMATDAGHPDIAALLGA